VGIGAIGNEIKIIMKKLLFIPIILYMLTGFNYLKPNTKIYIQPLGNVSQSYINLVKHSVKTFYGYDCVVRPKKEITKDMLSPIKKRIDANKALRKNHSNDNLLILTEKDICHYKNKENPEWGVFGLGLRPGKTCIISTFRMHKRVSVKKTLERLEKVVLHEIGHNLGLNHCTNNKVCMMNDANGTIKQVDEEKVWFCNKCRAQIN
jgi:archaemetzincin